MDLNAGYKHTEAGVLPEDWDISAVSDLVEPNAPVCYGVVQVGRDTTDGVPIVAIKYVKNIADAPLHRAAPEVERPYSRSRVRGKDVLISIKGTIGRVGVVPEGFDGNISRELARLRLKPGVIPEYIAYQLESGKTQARIVRSVVGTTRQEFSIGTLRDFTLAVPKSQSEQSAVAEALSGVDGLLDALDQLIVKKRNIKQSVMQQLLTGRTRLSGFSEPWGEGRVEDVILGYFCGPSPTCDERNIAGDLEWGVLKTTAVTKDNGWNWKAHKALPQLFWNKSHLEVRRGDVIVTKAGPRHRVGVAAWVDYVPPRIIVSGKMIGLRPDPAKILPLMLASAISAQQAQQFLDQRTTGMAESQVNFENSVLLQTPIRFPNIGEQTAITAVLSDIEADIAALEQRRDKTRSLKQAMMQELLNGRTRLVVAEAALV